MMEFDELKFYALKNSRGEWYRARNGSRSSGWVKELKRAKIYSNAALARSRITMFVNNGEEQPALIEFSIGGAQELDESFRIEKARNEKEMKLLAAEQRRVEQELLRAERARDEANARIQRLKREIQSN
jgi:hypothetical protein